MKFILDINSTKVLLTYEQLTSLADLLHGCEHVEHKYMGSKAGKSDYVDLIKKANLRDVFKTSIMGQIEYDAMVFVTKQLNENE